MPQVLDYENFKARLEEIEKRRQRVFLFSDADEIFIIKEHPTIYFEGETMRCGYTVKNRALVEIPVECKTRPEVKFIITNENILATIYQTVKGDLVNKTLRVKVDSEGNAEVEIINSQSENKSTNKPDWWQQAKNIIIALGMQTPDELDNIAKVLIAQGWANEENAQELARALLSDLG